MQLTPEQIQGIVKLLPRVQVDRLQGNKPYIRIGYWNQIDDLKSLNAGLAKLGLKAEENDDYDEDTGWNYSYDLSPLMSESNEVTEEFGPDAKDEMSPADYIKFLMDKFYEYRTLAMDPTITDAARKLYDEKAMDYYERAQAAMDEAAPDNTGHLSDEDKALPNVPMNELNTNRWSKLAGIQESSMDFDTYKVGDKIELNPKYFEAYQFPEGYTGVVKYIDKADYADETPVYTVALKNIDPTGDEYDTISVEYKQVKY